MEGVSHEDSPFYEKKPDISAVIGKWMSEISEEEQIEATESV
jgi:hypothetical protein